MILLIWGFGDIFGDLLRIGSYLGSVDCLCDFLAIKMISSFHLIEVLVDMFFDIVML